MRVLKPLVGLGLLALLLSQVDVDAMWRLMRRGRPELLAASLGSFVVALSVFQALRLHVLVADYTGGLATSLRLFFVGAFFNNLLPSNVGGDAVRLLYLRRMGDGDWAAPLARLLVHRATGILALLIGFLAYAPLRLGRLTQALDKLMGATDAAPQAAMADDRWMPWLAVAALCSAALALSVLLMHPRLAPLRARLGAFVRRFSAALATIPAPTLTALAGLTVAFHGMRMVGLHFALRFAGASIDVWDLVPVLAVTAVVALVPLTVGGLGLVEGSLGAGLALFGVPTEAAVAAALLHRVGLLLVAFAGGGVYLAERDAGRLSGERDLPESPG